MPARRNECGRCRLEANMDLWFLRHGCDPITELVYFLCGDMPDSAIYELRDLPEWCVRSFVDSSFITGVMTVFPNDRGGSSRCGTKSTLVPKIGVERAARSLSE
jgi:hypothetical protein